MPVKYIKHKVAKLPKIHSKQAQWSDKQKLQAVTLYMLVGKWALVSDETKIPIDTLKKWKQADWWKVMEAEIRAASHIEASASLRRIREKATSVVADRLDNGDFIYNPKTGKMSRRPVNAKTAADIAVKTLDKEILLEKLTEGPQVQEEQIVDRLKRIEEALGKQYKKVPQIIDVTPTKEETNGSGD